MAYHQTGWLDRTLTDEEEAAFIQYAGTTMPPRLEHWDLYHPVCRRTWLCIALGVQLMARGA